MSHTYTHCPTTWSRLGTVRRHCTLPFGHPGDHCDAMGPWDLRLLPCTATKSLGGATAVLSCRLSAGHSGLHTDGKTGVSWRDATERATPVRIDVVYTDERGNPDGGARVNAIIERQKFEAFVTKSLLDYDAKLKALTQHVTNLEHRHGGRLEGLETQTGKHAAVLGAVSELLDRFMGLSLGTLARALQRAR